MELAQIGIRVKELRIEKTGLSQMAFAEKIGLDRTYMSRVEAGKQNLKIETLIKICDGLGVTLREFFEF